MNDCIIPAHLKKTSFFKGQFYPYFKNWAMLILMKRIAKIMIGSERSY